MSTSKALKQAIAQHEAVLATLRSQLKDRQENGYWIIAKNKFGYMSKFIGQPFPKSEMRQYVLSIRGLLLEGAEELISISISPRQGYEQDIYYRLTIQYYKGAFQTLKCIKTFSIVESPLPSEQEKTATQGGAA